jgi:hypothetical protein
MSETRPMPKIPEGVLTEDQVQKIGGGGLISCSPEDINGIIANLQENYDRLVDFTSYVIETVANSVSGTPSN